MSLITKAVDQTCIDHRRRLKESPTDPPDHNIDILDYVKRKAPARIDALLVAFRQSGPMDITDLDAHIGDFFPDGEYYHVDLDLMVMGFKRLLVARLLDPLVAAELERQLDKGPAGRQ